MGEEEVEEGGWREGSEGRENVKLTCRGQNVEKEKEEEDEDEIK